MAAQILAAGSNDPITAPVTLTFSGPGAGQLIDAYSDPVTTLTTRTGFATLGVSNTVTPTESAPLSFRSGRR